MARNLKISGNMYLQDWEYFGPNEVSVIPISDSTLLDDSQVEEVLEVIEGVGGEVRGELLVRAALRSGGRIRVWVDLLLYEGTSEATSDLDGDKHSTFLLQKDQSVNKTMIASNTAEGDDDYAKVKLTFRNSA